MTQTKKTVPATYWSLRHAKKNAPMTKEEKAIVEKFAKAIRRATKTKKNQILLFGKEFDKIIWAAMKHVYKKKLTNGIQMIKSSMVDNKFQFIVQA